MDNLTHSLVGLAAAKAGLERASPFATSVCVIAANAPDADIVAAFAGSWFYLKHHRGITHSVAGTLTIALLIPVAFWIADKVIAHWRGRKPRVQFRGLLLASLILSLSHPLLDWTNSYGVRPLLPWSGAWFYGDLIFILDPYLWLSLGGASFLLTSKTKWRVAAWTLLAVILTCVVLLLPQRSNLNYPLLSRALWLLALAGFAVAYKSKIFARWNSAVAVVALALVLTYWGALAILHQRALIAARATSTRLAAERGEKTLRVAAMPVLANPLRWQCMMETEKATYRFSLSLWEENAGNETLRDIARYEKPEGRDAELVERASRDERAQILLDFARFPAANVQRSCAEQFLVQFADLRFTEPGNRRRGNFALEVEVKPTDR